MFINTSNRLTNFYPSNKPTIDTLLLIVQLIGYTIQGLRTRFLTIEESKGSEAFAQHRICLRQ
jgi:hypothetical protein